MVKAKASTSKTTAPVASKASAKAEKAVSKSVVKKEKPAGYKKLSNKPFAQGTGRRKSSVARVWLRKGSGDIIVNGRSFEEYFTVSRSRLVGKSSFDMFEMTKGMTADVNIQGGGFSSQADAVKLAVARALLQFDETLKPELRKCGFLTVDSRVKERKKYGQKAARRKFQFTKR